MFKLQPNPTFEATVQITVPGGDALPLRVTFKHKTSSAFAKFIAEAAGKTNAELVEEIVDQVHGAPVGMSKNDFFNDLFENYPAATADLFRTYKNELVESRVKN